MNLAILIDAENVLPASADIIFSHAASLGAVLHREIYGAATALTAWVAPVLKYAIHPNLTIKAAKGKNSSDIALVIGAMDLLLAGDVDGVIIASSDSDFSALSIRLRNAGIEVIGMGTDKANELWRTACSSFVVLQPQKAQPAPAKAEAAQPAPKQPSRAAHAPGRTHAERAEAVKAFITRQLESRGGRIQTGMLFPLLNRLPEYQADKKGSGKKPLNYLTSTFGDAFVFEESADGNSWVSLPAAGPIADEEPAAVEVMEDELPDVPAEEDEASAPAEEPTGELPAYEEEAPQPDPLALLMEAGLAENVASQIVSIFTQSDNQRAAYNRLRSVFGSTEGRRFYQLVKEIAGRQ
ncbi:MAG: NYN domain-containing protein [Clostridia bacterium]|nr:NYN domain-containing protein [Clostridia bacterium]MBO4885412.1 NYN domain-containing protein [Clostridia bacterium]